MKRLLAWLGWILFLGMMAFIGLAYYLSQLKMM